MAIHDDAFWDELGFAWRASLRDTESISRALQTRLKRQGVLTRAAAVAGVVGGLLGFALSGWTFWIAWSGQIWHFFARGTTLALLSLLAVMAALALGRDNGLQTGAVRDMLRVSRVRTERLIRATDLSCYAIVILVVGGTIGFVLRSRSGRPPALPLVEDLLAAALLGVALIGYRISQMRALKRYRYLELAFAAGDQQP